MNQSLSIARAGSAFARYAFAEGASDWASRNKVLSFGILFLAYLGFAYTGLNFAIVPGAGSPVWPAAGVGIAGLVLGGGRLWLAIVLARLLAGYMSGTELVWWANVLIALGNGGSALFANALLNRLKVRHDLAHPTSMFIYLWAAAGLGAVFAALIGTATLWLATDFDAGNAFLVFLLWFSGSAAGTILLGPLIQSWFANPKLDNLVSWGLLLLPLITLAGWLSANEASPYLREWHLFPILVLAAAIFHVRGASLSTAIFAFFAILAAGQGIFAFTEASISLIGGVILLQQLILILGSTALILGAFEAERERNKGALSRRLIQNIPYSVLLTDPDGRIVMSSKAPEYVMGVKAETLPGTLFWETPWYLRSPQAAETVRRAFDKVRNGGMFRTDLKLTLRDGRQLWIDWMLTSVRDETGKIVNYMTCASNIDGRVRAETERSRLSALIENSPDFIGLADEEGKILYLNEGASKMLGADSVEEFEGTSIINVHPPEAFAKFSEDVLQKAVREDGVWRGRNTLVRKDGSHIPVDQMVILHRNEGEPTFYSTVMTDVSERKKANDHQRLLNRELNHRVKNMLAVVQSIARQTIGRAGVEAALIDDFSARINSLAIAQGQLSDSNWGMTDLEGLFRSQLFPLVGEHDERVSKNGPEVHLHPEAASRMALAIYELSSNAFKYGALADPKGALEISWAVEDDRVHILWNEHFHQQRSDAEIDGFGTLLLRSSYSDFERLTTNDGIKISFSTDTSWGSDKIDRKY